MKKNLVKIYLVETGTESISMQQPYAVEYTTLISKKFHASAGCYINKTFIFYPIHRHKVYEQSISEQLIRDNNEISVHQRHLRVQYVKFSNL